MTLGDFLIAVLGLAFIFQLFMLYVMYRRIVQQQTEINSMKRKVELNDADFDLLMATARSIRNLR
jgi:hypothetical protein